MNPTIVRLLFMQQLNSITILFWRMATMFMTIDFQNTRTKKPTEDIMTGQYINMD